MTEYSTLCSPCNTANYPDSVLHHGRLRVHPTLFPVMHLIMTRKDRNIAIYLLRSISSSHFPWVLHLYSPNPILASVFFIVIRPVVIGSHHTPVNSVIRLSLLAKSTPQNADSTSLKLSSLPKARPHFLYSTHNIDHDLSIYHL